MISSEMRHRIFDIVRERIQNSVSILASDRGENQFSGIFIEFSGDVFLATATHCLCEVGEWDSLRLATAQSGPPGISATGFIRARVETKSPDQIPREDVALIHIPPDVIARLHIHPIPWTDCSSATLQPGALVAILGFPSRMMSVLSTSPVILKPGPFLYAANVSGQKPEPEALKTPRDDTVDVFIGYDPHNVMPSSERARLPEVHPRGLSGAGVFVVPQLEESRVWSLAEMRLGAVQSSFVPGINLLRAKRIELLTPLLKTLNRHTQAKASNNRETDAKEGGVRRGNGGRHGSK